MSTGTGLPSAGVGVRRGVASSLSNWVGVQSARVWVMCGGAGSWASTTVVLSASTGSTIFSEDRGSIPQTLPSLPPIEMADKQEK